MNPHVIRAELSQLKKRLAEGNLSDKERRDIMTRVKELEAMEATAKHAEIIANGALRFLNGESKDIYHRLSFKTFQPYPSL